LAGRTAAYSQNALTGSGAQTTWPFGRGLPYTVCSAPAFTYSQKRSPIETISCDRNEILLSFVSVETGFPLAGDSERRMATSEVHITAAEIIPLWVKAVVVVCVVLTGMGAVIAFVQPAMLVQPHAEITTAVRTYAGYLASRNAVLATMLLVLLIKRARRALGNLLAIVGLIQVLDCSVDCIEGRWAIAPGVLVLGIILLISASRLCGQLWRSDAWI